MSFSWSTLLETSFICLLLLASALIQATILLLVFDSFRVLCSSNQRELFLGMDYFSYMVAFSSVSGLRGWSM